MYDTMETTVGISKLKSREMDPQQKLKLQRAVKDFEAIFVGQMLKSMRASMSSTEMFGDSFGGDVLEGLFDMELSRHMSASSSFGLAEMLYKQITGDDLPKEPRPLPRTVPVPRRPPAPIGAPREIPFPVASVKGRTMADRMRTIEPHIHEAARKFGLDVSLIKAVIAAESAVRADALSNKNAKGLMQLIDSTAADMGVQNVWDPRENIMGGSRYLKMMLDRHQGDVTLALASYNAGPGAVDRFSGVPPYRETQTYIERVLNYREYFTAEE
jgi:Rod binding domain-containing protein